MTVFDFEDYREFLKAITHKLSSEKAGEMSRMAKALKVSTSFLSQVLQGNKNFSHDHAFLLSKYLRMTDFEHRYLIELVNLARATHPELKEITRVHMKEYRDRAYPLSGIPSAGQLLGEKEQAIFYSDWQHIAVQLLTGIKGFQTVEAISKRLGIEAAAAKQILNFLTDVGFCVRSGQTFGVGTRRTHLEKRSSLRSRHHSSWRLKSLDHFNNESEDEVFFTFPMRIDEETFALLSTRLKELMKEINALVAKSGNETLACCNIDFFRF